MQVDVIQHDHVPVPHYGSEDEKGPREGEDDGYLWAMKGQQGPRCYNCQGYGHIARNCPKGKGKGKGGGWSYQPYGNSGKGFGGKGTWPQQEHFVKGGKGKGTGKSSGCFICQSPYHYARNCPNNGKGGNGKGQGQVRMLDGAYDDWNWQNPKLRTLERAVDKVEPLKMTKWYSGASASVARTRRRTETAYAAPAGGEGRRREGFVHADGGAGRRDQELLRRPWEDHGGVGNFYGLITRLIFTDFYRFLPIFRTFFLLLPSFFPGVLFTS